MPSHEKRFRLPRSASRVGILWGKTNMYFSIGRELSSLQQSWYSYSAYCISRHLLITVLNIQNSHYFNRLNCCNLFRNFDCWWRASKKHVLFNLAVIIYLGRVCVWGIGTMWIQLVRWNHVKWMFCAFENCSNVEKELTRSFWDTHTQFKE